MWYMLQVLQTTRTERTVHILQKLRTGGSKVGYDCVYFYTT